jgi:hypothetical protein
MKHRHLHLLEKIQVQLAAVAALLVVYFGLWPVLRPNDPNDPVVFVATGSAGLASLFAAALWGLAALCALVTITARAEGAFMAALIGLGGMSLRSAGVRPLLWAGDGSLRGLYGLFVLETGLLLVIGAGGLIAAGVVRCALATIRPEWLWRSPLEGISEDKRRGLVDKARRGLRERFVKFLAGAILGNLLIDRLRDQAAAGPAGRRTRRSALVGAAQCLGAAMALAVVLLVLLLRSPDRGQIIFAVFASFALGFLIAHQFLPAALPLVAWVVPLIVGAGFYVLAAVQVGAVPPEKWMTVPAYARVLPVDWLTAGGGGALLGYLISSRIHEARHLDEQEAAAAE